MFVVAVGYGEWGCTLHLQVKEVLEMLGDNGTDQVAVLSTIFGRTVDSHKLDNVRLSSVASDCFFSVICLEIYGVEPLGSHAAIATCSVIKCH
eukprot:COSAG05_NODE_3912_length_1776_cov_155.137150_5_plen_93_part_00